MRPSWISEWNDFSNSESLCHRDASHHVLAQSNLPFERRCHLKNFKIASMVAILDIGMEQLKQFSIFMLLQCLPSSFGSIPPTVWEEMLFEVFKDGRHGSHLGYGNRTIFTIMNLYNSPKPPIKFQLNLTYCLGLDAV